MSNFSWNTIAVIGLLNILGGIAYFVLAITQFKKKARKSSSPVNTLFRIIGIILCPLALLLSGLILLFQGWRLDPILGFQQLLLGLVVLFLIVKDFIVE